MEENSILYDRITLIILSYFALLSCLFIRSYSLNEADDAYNTLSISRFRYPVTRLRPFESSYIRVDLPPRFSSLYLVLESDVNLDATSIAKVPNSALPLICLRDGSLPLLEVANTFVKGSVLGSSSNGSFNVLKEIQNEEHCYPMQKNMSMKLTNEQIYPGAWYLGFFNGIGATRTQSKMITRGPSFSFTANISVEGCTVSSMWGQYCNQSVDPLSCARSNNYNFTEKLSDRNLNNKTIKTVVLCRNSFDSPCHGYGEVKVYYLDVLGIAEEFSITAMNVTFNRTPLNSTVNVSGASIMAFARHGALPSEILHDYSGDISKGPLIVHSPKVGRWYISTLPFNLSKQLGETQNTSIRVCYSMELRILECPTGKAGLNCMWERYLLQTVIRKESLFESYYIPVSEKVSSDSAVFPLEALLSNSSYNGEPDNTWTYFLLDIPRGAAGGSIHIQLASDTELKYEIYAKSGGLPSLESWDYYYANRTNNSIGSMFFKLYNSSEEKIDFYILYVREGTWGFGIRHVNTSKSETVMSLSLERCPKRCSSPHGQCKYSFDASGLTAYSFCSCDRDHGGFDCSIEIISHQGHVRESIALIASNAAALLPAFLALRRKAFAEWIVFMASGIFSGIYHACDVGTWCALSFNVLQFMDFWLSFMAVVSTFLFLTTIDEALKRTIHTVVAILTALMAITKATRPSNIILVISLGGMGVLIGWLAELSTKFRSFSFRLGFCMNMMDRQQTIIEWIRNFMKAIVQRFRWGFVLMGFTALAIAAISWKLETSESYWIWHSVWHVTIYSSSFFFLCSKVFGVNSENQRPQDAYELTRQNSGSRGEPEGSERL